MQPAACHRQRSQIQFDIDPVEFGLNSTIPPTWSPYRRPINESGSRLQRYPLEIRTRTAQCSGYDEMTNRRSSRRCHYANKYRTGWMTSNSLTSRVVARSVWDGWGTQRGGEETVDTAVRRPFVRSTVHRDPASSPLGDCLNITFRPNRNTTSNDEVGSWRQICLCRLNGSSNVRRHSIVWHHQEVTASYAIYVLRWPAIARKYSSCSETDGRSSESDLVESMTSHVD